MFLVFAVAFAFTAGVAIGVRLQRRRDEDRTVAAGRPEDAAASLRAVAEAEHERLIRTMSVLPVGIVITDCDGGISFRNELAEDFSSGRHSDALVDNVIQELAQAGQLGERLTRDLQLYGPPRRHLVLRGAPVEEQAGYVGTVVSIEDTTEMDRVEAVRKDFVANVSHELKTPVGAMGVLAETLVDAEDPAVVARLSGRLVAEAIRLGNTIDDLLTLSQVESGEVFEVDTLSIERLIDDSVGRVAAVAELREVTFEVTVDGDLQIVGDKRLLVSALGNLVDNAVKYSDTGSTIEVSATSDGSWTSIEVADSGIGIPEGDLDRVFERFYRVDPARSRQTGGTGLGLSIVRNAVVAHGGEVAVRSTEGVGSVFTLRLPNEPTTTPSPNETPGPNETPSPNETANPNETAADATQGEAQW